MNELLRCDASIERPPPKEVAKGGWWMEMIEESTRLKLINPPAPSRCRVASKRRCLKLWGREEERRENKAC